MERPRLSEREGRRSPKGPYEGVPDHLIAPLIDWIGAQLQNRYGQFEELLIAFVTTRNEIVTRPNASNADNFQAIVKKCIEDRDVCLDVIDDLVGFSERQGGDDDRLALLNFKLGLGNSVYEVSQDRTRLVRRVDPTATDQFRLALTPADEASGELAQAWDKTYGRYPDPSEAWAHAIKAVEAILIPLVCPNKDKANLGTVAGQLKSAPQVLSLLLGQQNEGVPTLEAMLRLMWPNPHRRGSSDGHAPTQQEAQAVVHLAVTAVQWVRSGALSAAERQN